MARILNKQQCKQIDDVRTKIKALGLNGWDCEGSDDRTIVLFNNLEDVFLIADYYGNVLSNTHGVDITPELKQRIILEGQICQIVESWGEPKIEEPLCSYPDFEIWDDLKGGLYVLDCETGNKTPVYEIFRLQPKDYDSKDIEDILSMCPDYYNYSGELDDFSAYCFWKEV